jgi:hypothetical protein
MWTPTTADTEIIPSSPWTRWTLRHLFRERIFNRVTQLSLVAPRQHSPRAFPSTSISPAPCLGSHVLKRRIFWARSIGRRWRRFDTARVRGDDGGGSGNAGGATDMNDETGRGRRYQKSICTSTTTTTTTTTTNATGGRRRGRSHPQAAAALEASVDAKTASSTAFASRPCCGSMAARAGVKDQDVVRVEDGGGGRGVVVIVVGGGDGGLS